MFYIELREDGHRMAGSMRYETEAEAIEAAKRRVDDVLPGLTIHVLREVGHAFLRGDGEPGYIAADKS